MDVFLSSHMASLLDARSRLIKKIKCKCKNKVRLRCYEEDKHLFPNLGPAETYLALVRNCEAFVILFDQYYGEASGKAPNISPTHAELREAFKYQITIIPVARTQTWHEYKICRKNRDLVINYDYVKEPRLFEMLDEVFPVCNVHDYPSFISDEALTKIAEAIDAIVTDGGVGALDHVSLPSSDPEVAEPTTTKPTPEAKRPPIPKELVPGDSKTPAPKKPASKDPPPVRTKPPAPEINIPRFSAGDRLTADHMSTLFQAVYEATKLHGLPMDTPKKWKSGDAFKADDVNGLVSNIELIYNHIKRTPPKWSFGVFRRGSAFQADHMNELVDSVKAILEAQ